MMLNFEKLVGEDIETIVGELVDFVTRTDGEISEEKEKKTTKTPELKFFIARGHEYELGRLEETVEAQLRDESLNDYEYTFFEEHLFEEQKLNENTSYVRISTPEYDRHDHFIFFIEEDYLRVFTVERRHWTKRTVEKLIRYHPSLDRVFLSSEDLVDIVNKVEGDIDGFTAKYNTAFDDRKMSIQLHGGEERYLTDLENDYGVQPTRLEFSKTNSPRIEGTANRDGYGSIPRVQQSEPGFGNDTTLELTNQYVEKDQENFEVEHAPRRLFYRDEQSVQEISDLDVEDSKDGPVPSDNDTADSVAVDGGFTIEGYTTVELVEHIPNKKTDPDQESPSFEQLAEGLRENILDKKHRYDFSEWEEGNFFVFDGKRNEPFEITINETNILLHAKATTTADSLSDFFSIIHRELSTNYQVKKHSERIAA
ncbi:hypothetical protein Har1131_17430 [Haloarcula sp. CBA1131]|uniref:hypothetical protein n=1 Tax=Haloarcula sp. CBA1131 TaxID=1853686 RepID=UPI001248A109|nr:hypothetical protein [Haloarcula sp. CBA1131]KAA9404149.1 hypothetical protein Har1131_17430 [Haloarcula sp. CBA1131]